MSAKITLVFDFLYRGLREEYSSSFHVEGVIPLTAAEFDSFAGAVWNVLKPALPAEVRFLRAYWYADGVEPSDFTHDPSVGGTVNFPTGTFVPGSAGRSPGDAAIYMKHKLDKRTAAGKPVYSIHYFHPAYEDVAGVDNVLVAQRTALQTAAGKLIDGTLFGGARLCGPDGTNALTASTGQWITTRTLKRRGKRPPTGP